MSKKEPDDIKFSTEAFDHLANKTRNERYVLRLYIAGMTPKSMKAVENIKKICEEELQDCYELEVIDITQQPHRIKEEDLIATPTLIKKLPLPIRKFIGDMSNTERIIVGLNLVCKKNTNPT